MRSRRPLLGAVLALAVGLAVPATAAAQRDIDSLRLLAARDSNDATAHHALGLALLRHKRWDAADSAFRQAVALAPGYGAPWMQLALLPRRRGARFLRQAEENGTLPALALETRRARMQAFYADPRLELEVLALLEEELPRPRERQFASDLSNILSRVIKRIGDQKYDEAYREVQRVEGLRSGILFGSLVGRLHGFLALQQGDYPAAIESFMLLTAQTYRAESLGFAPSLAANEPRYALGTSFLLAGRFHEAALLFERVLELDASVWQAHVQRARLFEASEMWEEAIAERQAAITVNPEHAGLELDLGTTLLLAGRADEALRHLAAAEARLPRDPRAAYVLGMALLSRGDTAGARAPLGRFVAAAPSRMAGQVDEVRPILARRPEGGGE